MTNYTVLMIEDEEDLIEIVSLYLTRNGFTVVSATSGEEGLRLARTASPDLILLDVMLPGIDGLEACRLLKQEAGPTRQIPIIMLTAKSEESDVVVGLGLGADDYITKPFSAKILLARVRAALRRQEFPRDEETSILKIHNIQIDPQRFQVMVEGHSVDLSLTEFRILHLLARRPGFVFSRYQIIEALRGDDYAVTDRAVDVQIVGLRRKLGNASDAIETVRGVGYRVRE